MMLTGNATEKSVHRAGETTRSIADEGWEITSHAKGFSDHCVAGFPTHVPLCVEKQCKACLDTRVPTGSTHRSPAERKNNTPNLAIGETMHGPTHIAMQLTPECVMELDILAVLDPHSPRLP
ncbi:hypothetical protein NDU88_004452 [Pleurodeles waltl]|uniref:Uncharacterized protein n=1 Tax=Pleurodeles waltl TaxID=8319 RepID=A0AAV7KYF7_PLEWA|nr:hypothetical protein NDU88_004452 [Pleurodeles waltl]